MTIWYMDYESGTDANASVGNGNSFATRRKRIDNFVAAAIAPGDEIRIMASPAPSLVGNATWTDGPLAATVSIASSTNTTPIVITTSASHGLVTGDTTIINGHTTNTKANGVWKVTVINGTQFSLQNADGTNSVGNGVGGASGTSRKFTNAVVQLAAPVTQNIACCGNQGTLTNWTASANVTSTVITTDYKEGGECQQITISAGFTTGKASYLQITSLDLSAYQQVSFMVKQTAGAIGVAGATRLRLCTDTAGDTPVHDIPIPALGALNQWVPVVVNLGIYMNSAIQSVSFDVVTDNGAQTFLIDNIIACKASSAADSLNLTSLISKDPGDHSYGDGYECFWPIQSINDTRVLLDAHPNIKPTTGVIQRGYSGTTETIATYKLETIKTNAASSASSNVQTTQLSGTAGNFISYTGGWNRTDMSTQTGVTWFDGQNAFGRGIVINGHRYIRLDKINGTRYSNVISDAANAATTDCSIGRLEICGVPNNPISISTGRRINIEVLSAVSYGSYPATSQGSIVGVIGRADACTSTYGLLITNGSIVNLIKHARNNSNNGVYVSTNASIGAIENASGNGASGVAFSTNAVVGFLSANNNVTYGVSGGDGVVVLSGNTSGNISGGVGATSTKLTLKNFTIEEATEVAGFSTYYDARVYSEKHDGVAGNNIIFCDGGLIRTDATTVHGTAAYSWEFSPTSTNRSQYYPLNQSIAKVACAANSLVTIKVWFRRDNTGLTAKLVCKGGQISGVSAEVTTSMTAIANTWEELTITFTPTESGVVDIEAQFWGGTTYNGWVSDATISQA